MLFVSQGKLLDFYFIRKLKAPVDQKSLTWIRLIKLCYIVPWWPSWLSDQIALAIKNSMLLEEFHDCHNGRQLGYWN